MKKDLFSDQGFSRVLLVIAFAALFYLLRPVSTVIVLAIMTVYFVIPFYEWVHKKVSKRWSMVLTRGLIVCFLLIPSYFLLGVIFNQLIQLINDLNAAVDITTLDRYSIIETINQRLGTIGIADFQIDMEMIQSGLAELAQYVAGITSNIIANIGNSAVSLVTNALLYVFTVSGLLGGYTHLLQYIENLLPLEKKTLNLYRKHLGGMGSSMVRATVVIAFIQACITGLSLWIAGIQYIRLWTVLSFLLSAIPLIGASFVVIPIAAIVALMGNIRRAVFLIVVNQLITNNVDNFLRPKLVHRDIKINETLILLSVFGGMSLFGLLGVIYGPVMMSFVLVTFDLYVERMQENVEG